MELTINEIAELSGKSIKYIRREIANGSLKSIQIGNKKVVKEIDYNIWNENTNKELCSPFSSKKIMISKVRPKDDVNWIDISKDMKKINGWQNNSQITNFNFIDLFTGAGLVMAGMMPVGSVEIMPTAVETYKNNFNKLDGFIENITTLDIREKTVKDNLINSVKNKHINLIAGGFPCQGFSMAGNRIITDPRNYI